MTDKPDNVVSLADERLKRIGGAGAEAHARGEAMALMHYVFDERGIGYDPDPDDGHTTEVIVIVNGYQKGIAMSARDAIRLGEALVHAGKNAPSMRGAK